MSTLVYMKMLEQTPEKYDRGMRILTLGRIDQIKKEIVATWVEPDNDILEIGCGTGTLAAQMTARGARVTGIDISDSMLTEARRNAPAAEFLHMTATEVDGLGERRFDRIIATLSFSELTQDELDFLLRASSRLLKPDGKLVVADEMPASVWWKRLLSVLIRWPAAALTFLLTQNTTRALKGFDRQLEQAKYRTVYRKSYLLDTLILIVAEKQ